MSWSHRLATLEPSPSFTTVKPVMNEQPRSSSIFERRLAKYRSLPMLWLRTCGSSSSSQQEQRRTPTSPAHLNKDALLLSLGHIGKCFVYKSIDSELRRSLFIFWLKRKMKKKTRQRRKEECREVFVKAFLPFLTLYSMHTFTSIEKNKTHLFAFFSSEKSIILSLLSVCLSHCLCL